MGLPTVCSNARIDDFMQQLRRDIVMLVSECEDEAYIKGYEAAQDEVGDWYKPMREE